MKSLHLITLLVATAAWAAPDSSGPTAVGRETPASPPAPVVAAPAGSAGDPALLLPPVLVVGSSRYANQRVQPTEVKDRPFTVLEGGYYWKRSRPRAVLELKVQYHPGLQGFDLASLSW